MSENDSELEMVSETNDFAVWRSEEQEGFLLRVLAATPSGVLTFVKPASARSARAASDGAFSEGRAPSTVFT